jgi:opine dehydrogenase
VKYGYSKPAATLYEEYHNSPVFSAAKGPVGINDRYIAEDIPCGLVLWSSIAKNLGIRTPLMEAFIEIGSALCGKEFRKEGLTAEKLGLAGMNASQLNHYLMTGSK